MSVSIDSVLRSRMRPSVTVFQYLMSMEEKLTRAGFPPMSSFWKAELKRFYSTGKARFVARAGRRGGKSTSACRIAVAEAMAGPFIIPPGDTGIYAVISVRTKDARARLKNIAEILRALGIAFVPRTDELEIKGKNIVFRVYPCNWRAAVGMTCIGILCDEVARWHDKDTNANPANEVLSSVRPTMLTMVKYGAKELLLSSPWAKSDIHYTYFEMGETEDQCVCYAPTWIAHPELTYEMCKKLEPDDETFRREYEAIPMDSEASQFYDDATISLAMSNYDLPVFGSTGDTVVAGGDFGFLSDWSALAICNITETISGQVYRLADLQVKKPEVGKPLLPSEVCEYFAAVLSRHGPRALMLDQHNKASILEHMGRAGITYLDGPKFSAEAHIRCRTLMRHGQLKLPDDPSLRREFLSITGRPLASGTIKIEAPRARTKEEGVQTGHADRVAAIVNATFQRSGYIIEDPCKGIVLNLERTENLLEGFTDEEIQSIIKTERLVMERAGNSFESVELDPLDVEDFVRYI